MPNLPTKFNCILLILIAVVLQSSSFLLLKLGNEYGGYVKVVLFCFVLVIVFSRAFIWQRVLKLIPLSKAYPYTLLTQVLIVIYGVLFFGESLKISQLVGLIIISAGLLIISREN
jgi:drug/metabolite transporter (DMT)-like permease